MEVQLGFDRKRKTETCQEREEETPEENDFTR